jgi:hypothetical protein
MVKDIDFLKAKKKGLYRVEKVVRMINVASLVVLIFYCLIVAATIFLSFQLRDENKKLKSQIDSKKAAISELKPVESLQYVIEQRLAKLLIYFSSNKKSDSTIFSFFQQAITQGINVRKLEFTDKGEVMLSGQASNALTLGNFLDSLVTESAVKMFNKVNINSLTKQKDSSYMFNLALTINEES